MVDLLKRIWTSVFAIPFYCAILYTLIQSYETVRTGSGVTLEVFLDRVNMIPLYVNSGYLITCVLRVNWLKQSKKSLQIRLSQGEFDNLLAKGSIISCLYYLVVFYVPVILLNFMYIGSWSYLFYVVGVYLFLMAICEVFFQLLIKKELNEFLVIIPFLLNILLQYAIKSML